MYKVIILPLAKQDIKETAHWYNNKQNGLGKLFTSQVRETVTFIQKNPDAIAVRYDDIHCIVLDVFPFMLHYSVDDSRKLLIVSAVLHTSRSPETWEERS